MQTRDERQRMVDYCAGHGITVSDYIRGLISEDLDSRTCFCGNKECRYAYPA